MENKNWSSNPHANFSFPYFSTQELLNQAPPPNLYSIMAQLQVKQQQLHKDLTNLANQGNPATPAQAPHIPHLTPFNTRKRENLHKSHAEYNCYSEAFYGSTGNYVYPNHHPTQNVPTIQEKLKNSSNGGDYPTHSWTNPVPHQQQNPFGGYGSNQTYQSGQSQEDINAQMMKTLQELQRKTKETTHLINNLNDQIGDIPTQRPAGHSPSQPTPNFINHRNQHPGVYRHQNHMIRPPTNPISQHLPSFFQHQAPLPPLSEHQAAYAETMRSEETTMDLRPSQSNDETDSQPMQIDPPNLNKEEEKETPKTLDSNPISHSQKLQSNNPKSEPSDHNSLDLFEQVERNIPFLDSPHASKEFTAKGHDQNLERLVLSKTANSVFQSKLPFTKKDQGTSLISIVVTDTIFRAPLDLGTSINIIPPVLFEESRFDDFKPTKVQF
jgi:hypothetical protein